jgi:MoxR-like ATPase
MAVEQRVIETSLINKEEVFRMLALAEATGLPVLLEGPPGVGKTKAVLDYAKAWLNRDGKMSVEDFMNKIYILETDEGTKASEVKGMPDLEELFKNNSYSLNAPITEAEIVVINEVDKASSSIRNSLLGIMNEKFLFNGKNKIPCKWRLFVATCNSIPKDEVGSPFWDRFILKMKVERVPTNIMVEYFDHGGREFSNKLELNIPDKIQLTNDKIPSFKMKKFIDVGYAKLSDRSLTYVPTLVNAVKHVYNESLDKSIIKVASIMVNSSAATTLTNSLIPQEYKDVSSAIELLQSATTKRSLISSINNIDEKIGKYAQSGLLDQEHVKELIHEMTERIKKHPLTLKSKDSEAFIKDLLENSDDSVESIVIDPSLNPAD